MQDFNAKLSDFGLAKEGPTGDRTHVSTQVMGTHGYAAPEYVATGLASTCPTYYHHFLVPLKPTEIIYLCQLIMLHCIL